MNPEIKAFILKVLDDNRILSVGTVRSDGWPQVTTVGFGHDGLILYFLCGKDSQKARNLRACNKVSLTIDHDVEDMLAIAGVSMAATAEFMSDRREIEGVFARIMAKYPAYKDFPMPDPATVEFVRLTPKIISVLDYTKGFGHTELVEVTPMDLADSKRASIA